MEKARRCEFIAAGERAPERAVWSRKRVVATSCPKSLITAESLRWIEDFYAWKVLGGGEYRTWSAKQVDAFCALEQELAAERKGSDD